MQSNTFDPSDNVLLPDQLNLLALTLDLAGILCIDLRSVDKPCLVLSTFIIEPI